MDVFCIDNIALFTTTSAHIDTFLFFLQAHIYPLLEPIEFGYLDVTHSTSKVFFLSIIYFITLETRNVLLEHIISLQEVAISHSDYKQFKCSDYYIPTTLRCQNYQGEATTLAFKTTCSDMTVVPFAR